MNVKIIRCIRAYSISFEDEAEKKDHKNLMICPIKGMVLINNKYFAILKSVLGKKKIQNRKTLGLNMYSRCREVYQVSKEGNKVFLLTHFLRDEDVFLRYEVECELVHEYNIKDEIL